ncbi:hypothetical protein GCM10011514_38690 [Emticicia aquatilis]|uniref:Uncharacterized protein n=1 Tax=Emticicia aquatilis TaxID=1537369 RepID=A0A916Z225_9BACT|nr:hypothetical protein [Emticicia aquatilis]GGD70827.1 hypothetical protein GCM10011514_38690 [Emticicia aquatilis]
MKFDYDAFGKAMNSNKNNDIDVINSGKNYGWFYKDDDDSSEFNQVMEYRIKDGDHNYRTWHQESSMITHDAGMLVSVKIDHIRGENIDDHIVLLTGFDFNGKLFYGQAFVQMKEEDPFHTEIITSGDIIDTVHDQIQDKIKDNYGVNGSTEGRKQIPHIVRLNMKAMCDGVKK